MDSEMVKRLGRSITVPSVQELAKQGITKVPERYVYQNQETVVNNKTSQLPQIPVIDINKLLSEDEIELEKLDHACKEWGFFQVINHGVDHSLVESFKTLVQEFFNLSQEEKKPFSQKPGDMEGFGQMFVVSEQQKLEWADVFAISTLPSHLRNPNLFPRIPQPLRETLEKYALEMEKLGVAIIGFMSKSLKIHSNELLDFFEGGAQAMRMNYYPPCPIPEKVIGLNPHSDVGALTLLLQLNEMEGLQVRKDGMWIPVKPLPSAFVINIGDMLEIMTNGIYRSIEHRAVINSQKERISIATFHNPGLNAVVGPAQSLVTPKTPAMFNKISVEDLFKGYFARRLEGKSYIDILRIKS